VRSNRAMGGLAQPGSSQGHAATLSREQGDAGEEAHREVGHGGGVALLRGHSGEEGVSPMCPRAALAYGGAS
jgi:hypothetical protein